MAVARRRPAAALSLLEAIQRHHRRGVDEKRPWSISVGPGNGTRHLQKNKDDAGKQRDLGGVGHGNRASACPERALALCGFSWLLVEEFM
jgi:hypothetical protein